MSERIVDGPVAQTSTASAVDSSDSFQDSAICVTGLPGPRRDALARLLGVDVGVPGRTGRDLYADIRMLTNDVEEDDWRSHTAVLSMPAMTTGIAATPAGEVAGPSFCCSANAVPCMQALLARHAGLRVLAFYQAPWEAFIEACENNFIRDGKDSLNWLQYWLAYHQKLLQARAAAPHRVMVVNAGRIRDTATLASALNDAGLHMPDVDPSPDPATEYIGTTPLARLLAGQLAEKGREYWDIYEALESCALLIDREPEFQGVVEVVEVADLASFLGTLCAVQVELARAPTCSDAAVPHSVESEPAPADPVVEQLQQENDLLNLHNHQVYEELNLRLAENSHLRQMISGAAETAEQARCLISQLTPGGK